MEVEISGAYALLPTPECRTCGSCSVADRGPWGLELMVAGRGFALATLVWTVEGNSNWLRLFVVRAGQRPMDWWLLNSRSKGKVSEPFDKQ